MAVAQMAAGSCGGTFGTFQGCQTAVSKCNENKWLWLETLRVAAAELLEHLRAAKRQSQKPVNPDGFGPKWLVGATCHGCQTEASTAGNVPHLRWSQAPPLPRHRSGSADTERNN